MTPDTSLLIVGGSDDLITRASALDATILLLQHPSKITDAQRRLADVLRVLDYTDWDATEPVVRELYDAPGFAAAVAVTEAGLETAGRINDLLGLGGTGYEVAHLLRDKWAMRQHLAGRDPAAVGAGLVTSQGDLTAFGEKYGYPFVVKPANATASIGVFRVGEPGQAGAVWAAVRELQGTRTDRGSMPFALQDFLMEEYVPGPELSVESFSFGGRHVMVAITEKFVHADTFTELGHVVPARLDPAAARDVRAAVTRFLDIIGIRDGAGHTEVKIGPRGPAVIEGHNRVGGDAITDLVEGAYGIDLLTYSLGWPLGLVPELPDEPRPHAGAATRFLVGTPGEVESVSGVADARAQDGVLRVLVSARPGDAVRSLHDNLDRVGLIAVTAPDATAAIARAAEVAGDFIRISVAAPDGSRQLARVTEPG